MQKRKLLALAVIAAAVAVPSAQAHSGTGGWKVVASGLDNPRGIDVTKSGDIWIAEAGKGGSGPCQPGEEQGSPPSCFGTSGAYWSSTRRMPSSPTETPILPPAPSPTPVSM